MQNESKQSSRRPTNSALYIVFLVDSEESYLTYMNHSQPLIPDGIHRNEGIRDEARVP